MPGLEEPPGALSIFATVHSRMPRLAFLSWFGKRMLTALALAVMGAALQASGAQALPTVDFSVSPTSPLSHQEVTFNSAAAADPLFPDRTITSQQWDLNGDGDFSDGSGSEAQETFNRPGGYVIGLRVTESGVSGSDTAQKTRLIQIGNRAPVAAVVVIPSNPTPGEKVTLLSSSYDPDGYIQSFDWDLDGDRKYDDAHGSQVSTSFTTGAHLIGLRVIDDFGDSDSIPVVIEAKAGGGSTTVLSGSGGGPTGGGGSAVVGIRLLSPFPIVRVSGIVKNRGTLLRVLTVSAPFGATVAVRCKGRGCPFKQKKQVVESKVRAAARLAPGVGLVRIKRFGKRLLKAGSEIRVFVTKPDAVGKYTRLKIRRGRGPARIDRCLPPANLTPFPCPSG
jgi:hypothetical protein